MFIIHSYIKSKRQLYQNTEQHEKNLKILSKWKDSDTLENIITIPFTWSAKQDEKLLLCNSKQLLPLGNFVRQHYSILSEKEDKRKILGKIPYFDVGLIIHENRNSQKSTLKFYVWHSHLLLKKTKWKEDQCLNNSRLKDTKINESL